MSTTSSVSYPTVSLGTLLTVAFIVLKLIGVIHWSWWLVLLPFWGPIALGLVLLVIAGVALLALN
jgi:hypothetical protein